MNEGQLPLVATATILFSGDGAMDAEIERRLSDAWAKAILDVEQLPFDQAIERFQSVVNQFSPTLEAQDRLDLERLFLHRAVMDACEKKEALSVCLSWWSRLESAGWPSLHFRVNSTIVFARHMDELAHRDVGISALQKTIEACESSENLLLRTDVQKWLDRLQA